MSAQTNQVPPPATPEGTQVPAELKPSHSERFANLVMREFNSNVSGGLQVTDYQRQLIQGYFISIDRALNMADENRIKKNKNNSDPKFNNDLPCTWENVNTRDLALDVYHFARMGLDMMQPNHLFPVPYRNKKTSKYDITLMPGYNGIQYIAEKYAVEKPVAVTVELVYSTDHFKPLVKNIMNKVAGYEFEILNAFDRGEIVGGFGYIEFENPEKNKLVIMRIADILKRKPKHAAAEFWGGTTKQWVTNEHGKRVQENAEVDGWFEEMCLKTLKREVFSAKHIPRDPKKVDDDYQYMRLQEARIASIESQGEIIEHANTIDITDPADFDATEGNEPPPDSVSDDATSPDEPPPPPPGPDF